MRGVTSMPLWAHAAATRHHTVRTNGGQIMNKYIAEFIGTFFLVLTIGCTVVGNGAGALAPLAIGSALMVMIFAGGDIFRGDFNPAGGLGGWVGGKWGKKKGGAGMILH